MVTHIRHSLLCVSTVFSDYLSTLRYWLQSRSFEFNESSVKKNIVPCSSVLSMSIASLMKETLHQRITQHWLSLLESRAFSCAAPSLSLSEILWCCTLAQTLPQIFLSRHSFSIILFQFTDTHLGFWFRSFCNNAREMGYCCYSCYSYHCGTLLLSLCCGQDIKTFKGKISSVARSVFVSRAGIV